MINMFIKAWRWFLRRIRRLFVFPERPADPTPGKLKPGPEPEPPLPDSRPKPPVIPKVNKSLQYQRSKKIIAPFLIPTLCINKRIKDEDYKRFLDRVVHNEWGNSLRVFSAGMWEPFWKGRLYFPYKKTLIGRFNLAELNYKWRDTLLRRLGMMVERGIFPIVALLDNCSLKDRRRGGFWNDHWMNGDNNLNGTSTWMPSVYHYYEDEHKDKPGMRETKYFIEDYYRYLVHLLEKEFGPSIGYEAANEAMAGNGWHEIMRNILSRAGVPKARRFASISPDPRFDHFYNKPVIRKSFISSVHSIGNVIDYMNRRQVVRDERPFIASADGCVPPKTPGVWKDLVYRVLRDGNTGFESNLRPIFELQGKKWVNVCGKEDWTLTSMKWGWANAIREGWHKWLNS